MREETIITIIKSCFQPFNFFGRIMEIPRATIHTNMNVSIGYITFDFSTKIMKKIGIKKSALNMRNIICIFEALLVYKWMWD